MPKSTIQDGVGTLASPYMPRAGVTFNAAVQAVVEVLARDPQSSEAYFTWGDSELFKVTARTTQPRTLLTEFDFLVECAQSVRYNAFWRKGASSEVQGGKALFRLERVV